MATVTIERDDQHEADDLSWDEAVVFLRVPWEEAQEDHTFEIRLLDDSGQPVVPAGVLDGKPVSFTSRLTLNPDSPLLEESVKMVDIHSAIAVNAPALRIPTGQRYRWVVEVDGEEIGSTMFIVRPTPLRDDEANNASWASSSVRRGAPPLRGRFAVRAPATDHGGLLAGGRVTADQHAARPPGVQRRSHADRHGRRRRPSTWCAAGVT